MSNANALHRLAVLSGHITPAGPCAPSLARQPTRATTAQAPSSDSKGFSRAFPQAESAAAFPAAGWDMLALDALLTPEERALRDRVRAFMEREVAPIITPYWEKAEFPFQLPEKIGALGIGGGTIKGYECAGMSILANGIVAMEMARVDASVATFHLVHNFLAMLTIGLLGSEQQKQELLPGMAKYKLVGCWALTEPSNGSDASALTTTATKVPGGYMLDGQKRWIGNGTWADVSCVWARNSQTNQVNCFIVRKGAAGMHNTKIENKIALRCVQNADMSFERCFVPDSARLPGVESFQDTNKVLAISRVMVAWLPVGMAAGALDMTRRYLQQRHQFGTPLGSFQLQQERLARMAGNVNAMFLMAWRVSKLLEEGRLSHEQASMAKAWNTLRGREVAALAREMLGGNGVLSEFQVAKVFCDMEAIYTYEGTYDVNVLVAGRGLTGVSAIKAAPPRQRGKRPEEEAQA